MYYLVWTYKVNSNKQSDFEEEYSRNGSWFKFYEPCADYMGHELIKNELSSDYILIDKWMTKESYEHFVKNNLLEYDAINRKSSELYEEEVKVGGYNTI